MKKFLVLVNIACLVSLFISCSADEILETSEVESQENFSNRISNFTPRIVVFGRYVERCAGKDCVEMYRFNGEQLLEDISNRKPNWNEAHKGRFTHHVQYQTRLNLYLLVNEIPLKELNSNLGNVIGSPGAIDGAIYYLEVLDENHKGFWIISSNRNELPKEIRRYVDVLDGVISVLEEEDTSY